MKYKFLRTKAIFEIILIVTLSIFVSLSLNTKEVSAVSNGCCVADEQCSEGVSAATCSTNGGIWGSGLCIEGTNVALCVRGCCVIGDNAFLSTKSNCQEVLDGVYNADINTQDQCTALVTGAEEGCCVSGKNFKYVLRVNCDGIFFKNTLCKSVAGYAEAGYISHAEYKCGPLGTSKFGDIYYYDSGGNLEDIKEKCNVNNVGNPTSVCDSVNGEYTCKSLDCATTWDNPVVDGDGGLRKNGESWCEYQAAVGPGLDLPGTQHYRHMCINGKEVVDPCESDRSTICVQSLVNYGNAKINTASCVENTADSCVACGADKACCDSPNLNCIFAGGKCLPVVPLGNLIDSSSCGAGSVNIQTYWAKRAKGGWRCQSWDGNCITYGNEFLKNTNSLCNAYGDCGAKFNLAGKFTDGGYYRDCPDRPDIESHIIRDEGNAYGTGDWCLHRVRSDMMSFDSFKNAGKGLFMGEINVADLNLDQSISSSPLLLAFINNYFNSVYNSASFDKLAYMSYINYAAFGALYLVGVVGIVLLSGGTLTLVLPFIAINIWNPVGWIAMGVLVLAIIILAITNWEDFKEGFETLLGAKDEIRNDPNTGCYPWQVPAGGNDCGKCNTLLPDNTKFDMSDGYPGYVCTEQLCRSLGTQCEFKREEPDGPKCVKISVMDINAPVISVDSENTKLNFNCESPGDTSSCNKETSSAINIVNEGGLEKGFTINGELVDLYEGAKNKKLPLNISIKTNEDALCRFNHASGNINTDTQGDSEFKAMNNEFVQKGLEGGHTRIHILTLKGNFLSAGEHSLYVRCEDWNQNSNGFSYVIKYSVARQPDFSPPIIEEILPVSDGYLKYGEKTAFVELRVNEPLVDESDTSETSVDSGCRWSTEPNIKYEVMKNYLVYSNDLKAYGTLNITAGENNFYFKCMDFSGNANDQDTEYKLKVSETNLSIDDVSCEYQLPDGTTANDCANVYSRNFTLSTTTSGGVNDKAKCKYVGYGSSDFSETGDIVHKQQLGGDGSLSQGFNTGNYNLIIKCIDEAGNEAEKPVSINIKVDSISPEIIKVYSDGDFLNILTDEYSNCYYTNTKEFIYENATSMTTSSEHLEHRLAISGKTYYKIGCGDRFGNYMIPINIYL